MLYPDVTSSAILPLNSINNEHPGTSLSSLFEDLCYYWKHYSRCVHDIEGPLSVLAFLKIIIARHKESLLNAQKSRLCYERQSSTSNIEHELNETYNLIETFIHDVTDALQDLDDALIAFRTPLQDLDFSVASDWTDCRLDYQLTRMRYIMLKESVLSCRSAFATLASVTASRESIKETKRALKEAKNTKTLAFAGLIFIPWAYCSSLFSMNESYIPGSNGFWIY